MNREFKLASNLVPFSQVSDRFVPTGYKQGYEFNKQLDMLATVEGITGVALAWPCQFKDGAVVKKNLANHGLKLGTVDTDIYTEAKFRNGSLSNRDHKIRQAAIDRIKGAIDAALDAGAPDINLWLGHDGFEYAFAGHYQDAWKWIVDGLQEIAEYNSRMPISIEPKCKEPRANQYIANTGKALMLVNKIDRPHLGITLDFGHSLASLENPAECAVLAMMENRLQQIHLNDNYRDWDHDLIPGTVTVWEHLEFFYWVRKLGYDGWFCLDIFPYREDDGIEVLNCASRICHKCMRIADMLIEMNIEESLRGGEYLQIMRHLWEMIG